jgi:hypothetical protein
MKAQRRHELKTNILAQKLWDLPTTLRQEGAKFLVAGVIVLLAVVLIRMQITSRRQARVDAQNAIALARYQVEYLTRMEPYLISRFGTIPREQSESIARERVRVVAVVRDSLSKVPVDDAPIRAEARVLVGDLNWTVANLSDLPGAATQPSLRLSESRQDHLQAAKFAYEEVLKTYPEQKLQVITARLGLGAIAEDQQQWDVAKEHYQQVVNDPGASEVFKTAAGSLLQKLQETRQPILAAYPATQPTTLPTTRETALGPVAPATDPRTSPTTPSSMPQ